MAKVSDAELQDPGAWDYARPTRRRGTKSKERAIVSVAFDSESFRLVNAAAKRQAIKLSQFIREAALTQAEAGVVLLSPSWTSGRYVYPFPAPVATTFLRSNVVEAAERQTATTILAAG